MNKDEPTGFRSEALFTQTIRGKQHSMQRLLFTVALITFGFRTAAEPAQSYAELRTKGAFGFPQKDAKVLYDQPWLRLSVWNNSEYLFAQAVLWTDGDDSLGETDDNREIGDWSEIMLDLNAAGKQTPNVDRNYMLNPWPGLSGLRYVICLGNDTTTGIRYDSKGRGAIRYLPTTEGRRVRVDSYLIPMAEISRKVGDKIRLCYWGYSPKPELTVNSAGYDPGQRPYYSYWVPLSKYHDYVLASGHEIDAAQIPEDRSDSLLARREDTKLREVGEQAPEISAKDWINLEKPLTLQSLRGKVVLVEFWATWCGPCAECIPHLNEIHRKYDNSNFQLLSFVEEGHKTVDSFLKNKRVEYPIGLGSGSLEDYGVQAIPQAFVINREGKIIWQGISSSPDMEKAISAELSKIK